MLETILQGWLAIWLYIMAAIACTLVFAWLLISLPEQLLKDPDSPYAFTDRGYYEQYGEQYEQDNDVTYFPVADTEEGTE
ncbi:MAG: hypothetical protein ACOYA9_08055 [Bilifractor sp.]|jgi:hypothetical protein